MIDAGDVVDLHLMHVRGPLPVGGKDASTAIGVEGVMHQYEHLT